MNLPNKLTIFRIILIPVFCVFTLMDITGDADVSGIGIKSVELYWNSETEPYVGKYNDETGRYEFNSLPIGYSAIPSIVITDMLCNTTRYCMTSADKDNPVINLDENNGKIPLFLENIPPESNIVPVNAFVIPENNSDTLKIYKQAVGDHEEWWYPNDFTYKVTARDEKPGLYSVAIEENGNLHANETKYENVTFDNGSFTDEATYAYKLSDEGNYNVFTYATDNAQNTNHINPKISQKFTFHIDKTKPQITEFKFGGNQDDGSTAVRTTYGFFFTADTEARVYVEDNGAVSSGFNSIVLYLNNVNGENKSFTKTVSEFKTDDDGRKYASFTIEKGFKGKVISIVTDNVGHSSGFINANGNIVEDGEIHKNTSSIEIKENEQSKQNDANGIPLYNNSITSIV